MKRLITEELSKKEKFCVIAKKIQKNFKGRTPTETYFNIKRNLNQLNTKDLVILSLLISNIELNFELEKIKKIYDYIINNVFTFSTIFVDYHGVENTCNSCGGGGTVDCPECDGSGNLECGECYGGDKKCDNCGGYDIECDFCGGDGHVNCDECDGEGYVTKHNLTYTKQSYFVSFEKRLFNEYELLKTLDPINEDLLNDSVSSKKTVMFIPEEEVITDKLRDKEEKTEYFVGMEFGLDCVLNNCFSKYN